MTGTDDSALVASNKREPEELSREAQLKLLDQLLDDYRERLKELTKSPKELEEQLEKIDASLRQQAVQVNTTEAEFQEAAGKRRELRKKLEESRERRAEVGAMLERFSLLDKHYASDIERLRAIEEGGTLFNVLGSGYCPSAVRSPHITAPTLNAMETLTPLFRQHDRRFTKSRSCALSLQRLCIALNARAATLTARCPT